MRLLVTGGGTAGHVYPALSVVEALKSDQQTAEGAAPLEVTWVGSPSGLEGDIVRRSNIPFTGIGLKGGLRGVGLLAALRGLAGLFVGFFQSLKAVRAARAQVILATGGYVSVPPVLAGWMLRVPSLVYLPDLEPGWAVRFLRPFARRIAVTTEESRRFFPATKVVVTGYPVRAGLGSHDAEAARLVFGLEPALPTLLVMGGSRGAHSINMAVSGELTQLLQSYQVIHVTGQQDAAAMRSQREQLPADIRRRYRPYAFLHDDMVKALAAADVIVCRSGASVLGEIPCAGLAAILVPYAGGHHDQERNAQYLADRGAAVIISDADLSPSLLLETVDRTMQAETLAAMRQAAVALAQPDAAMLIGRELSAIARR